MLDVVILIFSEYIGLDLYYCLQVETGLNFFSSGAGETELLPSLETSLVSHDYGSGNHVMFAVTLLEVR